MSKTTQQLSRIVLVVVAGAGLVWLIRRRHDMPGLAVWQRVLAQKHGVAKAQKLAQSVRARYAQLLARHPLPATAALRHHLTQGILPGLALYQTLLQEYGPDRRAALAELDEAFRVWVLEKYRWLMAPLEILPAPFQVFRLVFHQRMKAFPAEGWDMEYLEATDQRIAFNATRCFYLKTLTDYGVPELTASFCTGDDVMAELFPPSIRFVRSHTLGRGDALCDFEYCRVKTA